MLYIVSTPIGNLSDISLRALEVFKTVDCILCEDTRVSRNLLRHYEIDKPLISFHSFNEKRKANDIIQQMKEGKSFALISDAGTPLIQDPGFSMVEACQQEQIPYTTVPGASSLLSAVILSGFAFKKFQFLGFVPKKTGEARAFLNNAVLYEGLSVIFESPNRLSETLELLHQINDSIQICVLREMTKKFESVQKDTSQNLIKHFLENPPRGEIVIVIQGTAKSDQEDYTDLAFDLIAEGVSKKTAYGLLSRFGFVNKDLIYKS